jgi:hypothetical protein
MLSTRTLAPKRLLFTLSHPAHTSFQAAARPCVAHMSTITDALTKDHRELERYYNEVVGSTDPDHQERYGNQFTWELARHSIGEELLVYPAFEERLGTQGKSMAEDDRKEHHQVGFSHPPTCFKLTWELGTETVYTTTR